MKSPILKKFSLTIAVALLAVPMLLPAAKNDYRLQPGSPATGKGIVLPKDLFDPQRPATDARPDIGAVPLGAVIPDVGRQGRIKSPVVGNSL